MASDRASYTTEDVLELLHDGGLMPHLARKLARDSGISSTEGTEHTKANQEPESHQ